MMQSFLATVPRRDAQVAAYASLTVALFTLGEFLMGIVWPKISDRLGRRPTLMIGVFGASLSALDFGFSMDGLGRSTIWRIGQSKYCGGFCMCWRAC